jgi:hypothetical protein
MDDRTICRDSTVRASAHPGMRAAERDAVGVRDDGLDGIVRTRG